MARLETLADLVDGLPQYGERPCVIAVGKERIDRWSYAELAARVQQLARGLRRAGLQPGQHVALVATPRPAAFVAILAIARAGGVVAPLDTQMADDVLAGVLDDCRPTRIFTTSDHVDRLRSLTGTETPISLLDADRPVWEEEEFASEGDEPLPRIEPSQRAALFYTSGTTGQPKGVPLTHDNLAFQFRTLIDIELVTPDDRVLLPLPLHHVYPFVIATLTPFALGLPIVLPFALTGPEIVRALHEGEVTIIAGVPRLYRALDEAILGQIEQSAWPRRLWFGASLGLSMWLRRRLGVRAGRLLLAPLHRRFGRRLRMMASGGAPLSDALAWRLEAMGWKVAIGYGLTETSPLITVNLPDSLRIGSVGRVIPGVEVRIDPSAHPSHPSQNEAGGAHDTETGQGETAPVPESDTPSAAAPPTGSADRAENPSAAAKAMSQATTGTLAPTAGTSTETFGHVGPGIEGEIQVRGPNVFHGYLNLPEKTREAFTSDGFFRTGDLGYFDADGYLYLCGRVSTLLVTEGGENVQPEDVEDAYAEEPAIREIGVLQYDGKIVAVIVPETTQIRGDVETAVREAVSRASRKIPSYQRVLSYVIEREALPRTRLGKIQRHKLRQRYQRALKQHAGEATEGTGPIAIDEMSSEDQALLDDPKALKVWQWLAERYGDRHLTPDTHLQIDLGVDSLEWLNLTMEIGHRVGVELDEEAIRRIETVRDLLQQVAEHAAGKTLEVDPLESPYEVLADDQRRWLEPLGPVARTASRGGYWLNRRLMRGLFHVEAEGTEQLRELEQFVIAPNHVSYLDPLAIAATLDNELLERTYWAAWVGVAFTNRWTRLLSRLSRTIPIEPERGAISSLALAAAVLREGKNLVLFPEGERSASGKLLPFKPGLGLLLEHYPCAVVPTYIAGTYEAWPRDRRFPRLARVRVLYGRPVEPQQLEAEGEGAERFERIVNGLARHLQAMVEQAASDRKRDGQPAQPVSSGPFESHTRE